MKKTLNEILRNSGYRTCRAPGLYRKHVLDRVGRVVFTGDAFEVWDWLRSAGKGER